MKIVMEGTCGHCGAIHAGACPRVAAIEYHQDGTIKRVEYREPARDEVVRITGVGFPTARRHPPIKRFG